MNNTNLTWIIVLAAAVALFLFMPWGGLGYGYSGMRGMMYNSGFGGMGIFMALIFVLVILAIIWFVQHIQQPLQRRR